MVEIRTAKATEARVKKGKEFSEGILDLLDSHPRGLTLYELSKLYKSSPGATLGAIERVKKKIHSKELEKGNKKIKLYFLNTEIKEKKIPGLIKVSIDELNEKLWKHNASVYGVSTEKIEITPNERPDLKKFLNGVVKLKKDGKLIEFVLPIEFIDFYELNNNEPNINVGSNKIIVTINQEPTTLPKLSRKKVLIIDDENNQIIKNIKDVLSQHHKVGEVDNLKDAKIRIRNEKPDFMILDWTLRDSPKEHKEIVEYLKKQNKNSRAILITAHAYDREEVNKEIRRGFSWFFSKYTPKLPEQILQQMIEVLA